MLMGKSEMQPRIRIFIDTHLSAFSEGERATFIEKLEEITGCPFDEFKNAKFTDGCVTFSGTPPDEPFSRLYETYRQRNWDNDDPAQKSLRELFRQSKVKGIEFEGYDVKHELTEKATRKPVGRLIAFIHGYTGDSTTFGQLPKFLSDEFGCPTLIYSYPTSWYKNNPSLFAISNNFGNWLRRQGRVQHVAIISHSMGGVIARMCLAAEIYRTDRYDEHVVLLSLVASPNSGAQMANVLNFLKVGKDDQVRALATSEDFITELNRNWAGWLKNLKPKRLQVKTIYGDRDAVVPSASAIGWDSDPVNILGVDHIGIVKPKTPTDEVVEVLKHQLVESGF
jgi:hypothetical protein